MTTKSETLIISLLVVGALYTTDAAISWTTPNLGNANGDGTLSLAEDQAIDTTIETYVATGAGDVTYALTPAVIPFALTEAGVLTITAALDFETKQTYTLNIVASDSTGTGTATITVTVTDVEEAIAWTKPDSSGAEDVVGTLSIREDQTINTPIETYVATGDTDVTYTLTPAVSPFALTEAGVLTITAALDFETTQTYTLHIVASAGTNTGTATITVTVTEVEEDAAIAWTKPDSNGAANGDGTLSIREDQAIDTTIETYVATGATSVTYALTPAVSPFALTEGGVLTITAALDNDNKPTYTLHIVATDVGGAKGTATIAVTVTNVDPVFSSASYSACIADKSPADTTLTTVTATVPDTSKTITYAKTSGDDNNDFKIGTNNGIIQVNDAKTLNKTVTASYTLVVTAATVAPDRTGTTTVSVTVADSCDNGDNGDSGAAVAVVSMVMMFVSLVVTLF